MMLCGRHWWDRIYYHPSLPTRTVRIQRDAEFIEKLADAINDLNGHLAEAKERLLAAGCVPREPYVDDPRPLVEQGFTA